MADIFSPEVRSSIMSRIRGKDTKPELVLRKALFSLGIRYRLHQKKIKGTPDLVLKKYRTVIFVHGCFWHGHNECRDGHIPKTRSEFWQNKISRNQARDVAYLHHLESQGWNVITVWECEIKKDKLAGTIGRVVERLHNAMG